MWHQVEGHDRIVERFRRGLETGRLPSTFLFVGPPGIGKRTLALRLAQALLCEASGAGRLEACGYCEGCQLVQAGTHPDLAMVERPADKSFIPLDLLIGDREQRMRSGLCHAISLKPMRGGRKIAIIDDADYLNQEGANALLKTLEEPPPKSLLILIGTSEQKQLPTIRSRCQIIRFRPLAEDTVERLLVSQGIVTDPEIARRVAALAEGSLQQAAELADEPLQQFRAGLLKHLASGRFLASELAAEVSSFVDAAGKEAPPRRARLRQVIAQAREFYRQLLRQLAGAEVLGDELLGRAVQAAARQPGLDAERVAAQLDRCLEAEIQLEANANQATLIETWLDDLAG